MNRTRYILRDEARRRERREAEIERQVRAERTVDTGLPPFSEAKPNIEGERTAPTGPRNGLSTYTGDHE